MQTTELKSILIAKINKIEDNHLLMEASRLINIEIPAEEENYVFSDVQSAKIINALTQVENGEYLTSEAASKEIEEWLKK